MRTVIDTPMSLAVVVGVCASLACSSGSSPGAPADGGKDGTLADAAATSDCAAPSTDASYSCDVSTVPPGGLSCGDWEGMGNVDDSGAVSCPGVGGGWSGGPSSRTNLCTYSWMKAGPPDPCELPGSETGQPAFSWLQPACDAVCP